MSSPETDYPCVGVCLIDAETGYCLGCGRPPAATPADETATVDARHVDGLRAHGASNAEPVAEER